mmetsp:Transcript_7333/g.16793  ORF Transcript_7333/g.16793 Transcript_7333/m.16793 type:complete len:212 (-) Transcript_7333:852-1487(-)
MELSRALGGNDHEGGRIYSQRHLASSRLPRSKEVPKAGLDGASRRASGSLGAASAGNESTGSGEAGHGGQRLQADERHPHPANFISQALHKARSGGPSRRRVRGKAGGADRRPGSGHPQAAQGREERGHLETGCQGAEVEVRLGRGGNEKRRTCHGGKGGAHGVVRSGPELPQAPTPWPAPLAQVSVRGGEGEEATRVAGQSERGQDRLGV